MCISLIQKEKIGIAARSKAHVQNISQSRVAAACGTNKTVISWIFSANELWRDHSISNSVWRSIAKWADYHLESNGWEINRDFPNFRKFYNICSHAKSDHLMIMISDLPGRGKTTALREHSKDHTEESFYIECDSTMSKKVFLYTLAQKLGIEVPNGYISLHEIMEMIKRMLNRLNNPVILMDEWNDLPRPTKGLTKTIYNKNEGHLGMVLCGGKNLKKDMDHGVRNAVQSYQEIYSRSGGKTHTGKKLNDESIKREVFAICTINSVDEQSAQRIVNNYGAEVGLDLREVRRDVQEYQLKVRNQKKKAGGQLPLHQGAKTEEAA